MLERITGAIFIAAILVVVAVFRIMGTQRTRTVNRAMRDYVRRTY